MAKPIRNPFEPFLGRAAQTYNERQPEARRICHHGNRQMSCKYPGCYADAERAFRERVGYGTKVAQSIPNTALKDWKRP